MAEDSFHDFRIKPAQLPETNSKAAIYLVATLIWARYAAAGAEPVRLVQDPALSSDGQVVAFGWQGDIWTMPTAGGRATRLTANAAMDSGPAFSPDGLQTAFNRQRDGSKMLVLPGFPWCDHAG